MSGIGGYMPRKDRVKGTIVHLERNCKWCGESYAEIRKGTVKHDMSIHHEDWPTTLPLSGFEPFEVK